MLNITYTISPNLVNELKSVASLRQSILLFPISAKFEYLLQFESLVDRIENSLGLDGVSIDKVEIKNLLSEYVSFLSKPKVVQRSIKPPQKSVYNYRHTYDFIRQRWLVSNDQITIKDILEIHNILSSGSFRIKEQVIKEVLEYLQTAEDNPVIQAAIAKLAFRALEPFDQGNELSSTFFSYLFLFKAGLDFKGLLVLERFWNFDKKVFQKQFTEAVSKANITPWLEYFARTMNESLKLTYGLIGTKETVSYGHELSNEISERQHSILTLFDEPNAVVTNRKVQKFFKVSQITASRDLAKLANLGLLFVHGKGRSVRYTKI